MSVRGSVVEVRKVISPVSGRKATEFTVRVPDVFAEPHECADTSDGSFGRVELFWLNHEEGEA